MFLSLWDVAPRKSVVGGKSNINIIHVNFLCTAVACRSDEARDINVFALFLKKAGLQDLVIRIPSACYDYFRLAMTASMDKERYIVVSL